MIDPHCYTLCYYRNAYCVICFCLSCCLHTGNPVTNFTSNLNGFLKYAEATFLPLMYLWRETPHAGAFSTVYAATAPEAASSGIAGVYIMDCAPARHSPEAADEAAADKLWELSEQLCARTLAAAEKK